MFQEPALFPWLTAAGNVELALRAARGRPRPSAGSGRPNCWTSVHLGGFGGKRPHELSGGMRQRVALARALAQDADVLLMDEPFGALDAMTRDLLHDELERICAERGLTVLFVTHNVREAVRLGDRVVLLSSRPGRVIEEFTVPIRPPAADRLGPRSPSWPRKITDRLREEVSPPWQLTPRAAGAASAGRPRGRSPRRARRPGDPVQAAQLAGDRAGDIWAAVWPKLLAIAHRPRRLGARRPQRLEDATCCPGPATSSRPVAADAPAGCSGRPSASPCAAR